MLDRSNEAVSRPGNRLNIPPFAVLIAESFAQSRNVNGQYSFFDRCLRPDQIEKLALGYQPSRTAHQGKQHVVRFGSQRNSMAFSRQQPFRRVQLEFSKLV